MPERWNKAAQLRKEQIESGLDITFNRVFVPHFQKCIEAETPRSVLEVGCGTGHLSAKLVKICQDIEALEPSPGMHAVAAEVLADSEVVLHHVSAEKFKSNRKFDVVLSHLCGHVVADLDSFFRSCAAFVAPSGSFILSLPHPCFWNEYRRVFPTEDYRYMQEAFASTTLYITKDPNRPIEAMPFHHRPLSRYLNALHGCGMALKSLDEIVPSKAVQAEYDAEWLFPRYCVLHAVHLRH